MFRALFPRASHARNDHIAKLRLRYDGKLTISNECVPKYIGGEKDELEVSPWLTLEELKGRIIRRLNYDAEQFTVDLVCRFPIGNTYAAMFLNDNEQIEKVLSLACSKTIVLYVEAVPIQKEANEEETNNADELSRRFRRSMHIRDVRYEEEYPSWSAMPLMAAQEPDSYGYNVARQYPKYDMICAGESQSYPAQSQMPYYYNPMMMPYDGMWGMNMPPLPNYANYARQYNYESPQEDDGYAGVIEQYGQEQPYRYSNYNTSGSHDVPRRFRRRR